MLPTEFAQTLEENAEPEPTHEATSQPTIEVPAEPESTPEAPVELGASTPIINSSVDNDIETAGFTPIPTEMPAEFTQTVEEDVHSEPIVEAPTETEPTLEVPIQPTVEAPAESEPTPEAPIQPTVEAPVESEQNPSEDQIHLNFDSSMSGFVNEPVLDLPTEPFADAYVEAIEPNPTKTSIPEQDSEPETISEQEVTPETESISEAEQIPEQQTASETESISGAESVSESESIPETGTEPEHVFESETKSEPEPEPEPQFQDYTFQLPYEAGKTLGRNPFEQSADD